MDRLRGFFRDNSLGQDVYRCKWCPFDTFERSKAIYHFNAQHLPFGGKPVVDLPETDIPIGEWVQREKNARRLAGTRVKLGFLTWNTVEASIQGAAAIVTECRRLREFGLEPSISWSDNGSTDGTVGKVGGIFLNSGFDTIHHTLLTNEGQSIARNLIIEDAVHQKDHYLMFIDGDVEIIPWSAYAFCRYLAGVDEKLACVGMYTYNCTPKWDEDVALECRCIEEWMVSQKVRIAWTNYGMFRVSMFASTNIRFDTSAPFLGPGWGYEDDDLYLQMNYEGYDSVATNHFRFLHRHRSSSIPIMGRSLATKVYESRRRHIIDKWKPYPFAQYHVSAFEANQLPLVIPTT